MKLKLDNISKLSNSNILLSKIKLFNSTINKSKRFNSP